MYNNFVKLIYSIATIWNQTFLGDISKVYEDRKNIWKWDMQELKREIPVHIEHDVLDQRRCFAARDWSMVEIHLGNV